VCNQSKGAKKLKLQSADNSTRLDRFGTACRKREIQECRKSTPDRIGMNYPATRR
jgi:hypothetical protein